MDTFTGSYVTLYCYTSIGWGVNDSRSNMVGKLINANMPINQRHEHKPITVIQTLIEAYMIAEAIW
uniref:Uncharacterized protein n=1 Tax=Solanum tuberosum TaxID=4113 RepID=M1CA29_SOLTU